MCAKNTVQNDESFRLRKQQIRAALRNDKLPASDQTTKDQRLTL